MFVHIGSRLPMSPASNERVLSATNVFSFLIQSTDSQSKKLGSRDFELTKSQLDAHVLIRLIALHEPETAEVFVPYF